MGALQAVGTQISRLADDPAQHGQLIGLLNALGKLPGGIGKLFANGELNARIVASGAAKDLFNAAGELAQGDLAGAAEQLFLAGRGLLSHGERALQIPGTDLSVTEEGLQSFGQLFGAFWDALPNGVKNRVTAKISQAAANAIPVIGDFVSEGMDAVALYDALQNGDGLDQLIAGGQLLLNAAGPLGKPLKIALAGLQAFRAVSDMSEVVGNARGIFFGTEEDSTVAIDEEKEAVIHDYFGTQELTTQAMSDDGLANNVDAAHALVQAARGAHIPPDRFSEFVAATINASTSASPTGRSKTSWRHCSGRPNRSRARTA
jgi:hypothetical protein